MYLGMIMLKNTLKEYDNTNPLNYYGKTKEEAEEFIYLKNLIT